MAWQRGENQKTKQVILIGMLGYILFCTTVTLKTFIWHDHMKTFIWHDHLVYARFVHGQFTCAHSSVVVFFAHALKHSSEACGNEKIQRHPFVGIEKKKKS